MIAYPCSALMREVDKNLPTPRTICLMDVGLFITRLEEIKAASPRWWEKHIVVISFTGRSFRHFSKQLTRPIELSNGLTTS
jgi:hypothetical protein